MASKRKPPVTQLTPAQKRDQKAIATRNAARAAAPAVRPGQARHGQTSSRGDSAFTRKPQAPTAPLVPSGPLSFLKGSTVVKALNVTDEQRQKLIAATGGSKSRGTVARRAPIAKPKPPVQRRAPAPPKRRRPQ